jgi:tetratricopeptide (TPR) repeat protein
VADALINRGLTKEGLGDIQGAVADYTAVVMLEGVSKGHMARAMVARGLAKGMVGDTQGALADYTAVVTLAGASKEAVAVALINRGVAKGRLGDSQGELADYTAVATLEDASKEAVANALFNRGVANLALGQEASAIADWTGILELGVRSEDSVSLAAGSLFRLYWPKGAANEANNSLDSLAQYFATNPPDQRALKLTEFLARLASPAMREGWLHAARRLLAAQPPETRQALGFLEPVCRVLEGGEKSLIDPLPPEQRDFAFKVLARFDGEKKPPADPPRAIADPP